MKKTLAALAVLGAFAGTSLAADVTLYGVVDTGFRYTNTKVDGSKAVDKFEMKSGQRAGSRFGLKGTEELGNGLTVGFNLENAFNDDDGTLDASGRLFHRESILFIKGGFGELAFGRTGGLDAGTGSYNLFGSAATPFGNGWSDTTNDKKIFLGKTDRMDNAIVYKTPTFAGVTVYAMASLKNNNKETEVPAVTANITDTYDDYGNQLTTVVTAAKGGQEGSSDANRYYALGAKGAWGPATAGLVVSQIDYSRTTMNAAEQKGADDALAVSGYGAYDFGVAKVFLAAEYFDKGLNTTYTEAHKKLNGPLVKTYTYSWEGYGIVAGASAPVLGGKAFAQFGYNDADSNELAGVKEAELSTYQIGLGYEYPLSKRTYLFAATGYMQQKIKDAEGKSTKTKTTEALFGVTHNF